MNTFLQTLQQHLAHIIHNLPAFHNTPVLIREPNNWKNSLLESIQTSHGLSIIVLPPSPHHIQQGVPGFACEQILLRIEIIESPLDRPFPQSLHNEGRPSALSAAETLAHALNRMEVTIDDWSGCLELVHSAPWKEIHDSLRSHHFILELQFFISGLLPIPLDI